jgi:hypothetical protein
MDPDVTKIVSLRLYNTLNTLPKAIFNFSASS